MMSRRLLSLGLAFVLVGCVEVEAPTSAPTATESVAPSLSPSSTATEEIQEQGTFNISVFNLTDESFDSFEVWVRGSGSWYPDLSFAGDLLESVGPFGVGSEIAGDIFAYPFGREGAEVPITIFLNENHISDSTRDSLFLTIDEGIFSIVGPIVGGSFEVPLG